MSLYKRFVIGLYITLVFIKVTNAQVIDLDKPVNLKFQNESVSQAIESVRKVSGIFIAYTSNISNIKKVVTFSAQNMPLGEVMNRILEGTGYIYIVFQNQFIIQVSKNIPQKLEVKGVILDAETLQPVSYTSVAIINSQTGTISDINGEFELELIENALHDTLVFSSMGYTSVKYSVEAYLADNTGVVKLPVSLIDLEPVIIKPDKGKIKWFGNHKNRPAGSLYLDTHGQQTALLIEDDNKEEGRIKTINYYLSEDGNTDAPFRIHIYEVDSATGKPGKDLIPGILVAKPSKGPGWFAVDVWQYNIHMSFKGLFVAMEGIFPNDYDFYRQDDGFIDLSKVSSDIQDNDSIETINYGQKLGYTKNKRGKNFTWHYSLDHRWFQLKRQNMGIMVSAEVIINKTN